LEDFMSEQPKPFPPISGQNVRAETPNGTARSEGQHPGGQFPIAQPRLLNGRYTAKGWPAGNRTGE
jgi:hypothetical protein